MTEPGGGWGCSGGLTISLIPSLFRFRTPVRTSIQCFVFRIFEGLSFFCPGMVTYDQKIYRCDLKSVVTTGRKLKSSVY